MSDNKPTLLRWWCLNCQEEHTDTMPLEEAAEAARSLLAEGTPYALLYDAVHWALYQADKAEDEARCKGELADPPPAMQDTGEVHEGRKVFRLLEPFTWRGKGLSITFGGGKLTRSPKSP